MKAHELLIRRIKSEDLGPLFTLMAEDIMGMMSKIEAEHECSIPMVKVRHEQNAVAMADGYARTSDDIGMAMVGRGPAVAQTGNALVTARKRDSDVLVLVPESPISDEFDHKRFDQESFLLDTIGNVTSIRSTDILDSEFADAIRRVRLGDGPLAVQIPWDILDSEIDTDTKLTAFDLDVGSLRRSESRVQPDASAIEEAVDLYIDSAAFEPPVVLAGRGAIKSGAKTAIEQFAERTSALLSSSLQARNYFSDHPFYLGFTGQWGTEIANKYVTESQLVFAFGASLNPYTTDHGRLFDEETEIIHVDADPQSIGRYTDVDLGIKGDVRDSIEALTAELERRGINREGELWTSDIRREIEAYEPMNDREFEPIPGTVDPREVVRYLDVVLPDDRRVVTDAGHFIRWVLDAIETDPENFHISFDFSSIGLGLPMGIGAAVGSGSGACVTICGDAGAMMSLQELETAIRNAVPMTVIVMNDSALGSEYHGLDAKGQAPGVAEIQAPDFGEIANSMGGQGYTIRDMDDLSALSDELSRHRDEPLVIDCKINLNVRHRSKM